MGVISTAAMIGIGAAVGGASGLTSGLIDNANRQAQADVVQSQASFAASERIRSAEELQKQQTVGFLKSGVYLEGTPQAILDETRDYAVEDVRQVLRQGDIISSNLRRQGTMGIFTSTLTGTAQGAMAGLSIGTRLSAPMGSFANIGGGFSNFGSTIKNVFGDLSDRYMMSQNKNISGGFNANPFNTTSFV